MNIGLLAYLLIVSGFATTIFVVSMPLLVRSEKTLPTKIYTAGISVALLTSLIAFLYVSIKTENLFFEDQNLYIKTFPVISGFLVPLALWLQPLFLRSTRKKITSTCWFWFSLPIFIHILQVWFALASPLATNFISNHANTMVTKTFFEFIFPASWLLYESIKINRTKNNQFMQIITYTAVMGVVAGLVLFVYLLRRQNIDILGSLPKEFVYDQILYYRIFRGSWYCIFQIFICFYWASRYSANAVMERESRKKLNILLAEKDELIRNLSNKNILIETGGLSAGLAHELNQFLARIELNSGEVLDKINHPQVNFDEVRPALQNILSANHSAANLVSSLKKLFQSGKSELTKTNMDELVKEVVQLYAGRAMKSKISIELILKSNLVIPVWDVLIRQSIANLIANSIDALDILDQVNKSIQIETWVGDGGMFCFAITDNGLGITPDRAQHLFSLFFSSKSSGSGIGLWLANYIVERHGGKLSFQNLSKPGGVRFQLNIPTNIEAMGTLAI